MRMNLKTVILIAVFAVLATLVAVPALAATTPLAPSNPVGAWCSKAVDGIKSICSPGAGTGTCSPAAGTGTCSPAAGTGADAPASSAQQGGGCCGSAGPSGAADSSI